MFLAVLDCRQNLPLTPKTLQSATMKPTVTDRTQISFLLPDLESQINLRHPLCRLARAMDWGVFEKEFGALGRTFLVTKITSKLMRELCLLASHCRKRS